ncbi:MAG: hypothetical protein LBH59_00980, partial [Planctomycetaceae bacterium]|nr:hypothetical protein [Planctomycetaceae bacterium]
AFSNVASIVRAALNPLVNVVQNIIGNISNAFAHVASIVRAALNPLVNIVQNIIGNISNAFAHIVSIVRIALIPLPTVIQNIVAGISSILSNVTSIVRSALSPIIHIIQNIIGNIVSVFNNTVSGISNFCNAIRNLFSTSFIDLNTIVSGFRNSFNTILSNFGIALNWLGEQFRQLYSTVSETFNALVSSLGRGDIEAAIQLIWASIKMIWAQGTNSILTTWYWLVDTLQLAWGACVFRMSELLTTAWYGVQQLWSETVYSMSALWIEFSDTIMSTWKRAEQSIAQGIGYIIARMQGLDPTEMSNIINDNYNQQTQQRETDKNRRLVDTQNQHDQRMSSLELSRTGTLDILQEDFDRNNDMRNATYEAKLAAQEQELAAAKAAYNEAINRAKNPVITDLNEPESLQDRLRSKIEETVRGFRANTDLESKVSVSGSFSAAALQSMGAGSSIDRVAKATEKSEKHLEKLVNKNDKPIQQSTTKKIDESENENDDNLVVRELKQQTRFLRDMLDHNNATKFV